MVYFKENYNFTRFRGGGVPNIFQEGPTFSKLFPVKAGGREGGGRRRGVQMLILETHRACDFPGGGANPLSPSPLDPRM